jgi:glutathione S-transferase
MTDYDLYYWPIPFRGQFVRAVLAYSGKSWREHDGAGVSKLKDGPLAKMPAPFMGPPVLIDKKADVALSQTSAILLYLGETLNLLPSDPASRALSLKIAADAVDVLDDITLDGGRLMWTKPRWKAFLPRLAKWMSLFEETARRRGVTAEGGFLFGEAPGIADIVTATLWSTMGERFPALQALLDETAPLTAALTRRVAALPALAKLAAKARHDYGDAYCGGQIEASLRKVMGKVVGM